MEAKLGTYTYKHPTYDGHGNRTYIEYEMRVKVIGERANKWRVEYLGFHASGERVGSLHNVRKDKVRLDNPIVVTEPLAPTFTSPLPDNYRLPYKDNDDDM